MVGHTREGLKYALPPTNAGWRLQCAGIIFGERYGSFSSELLGHLKWSGVNVGHVRHRRRSGVLV